MEPNRAVAYLQSRLDSAGEIRSDEIDAWWEAVIESAKKPVGYSGLSWQAGARLINSAHGSLDRFPTAAQLRSALASGLGSALRDGEIITALASLELATILQEADTISHFASGEVDGAITQALEEAPRPFVAPAKLAGASELVQDRFSILLERVAQLGGESELIMQWAAAGLRVMPNYLPAHLRASRVFLQGLVQQERWVVAYYAFRALAEQHESLWEEPLSSEIMFPFIEQCIAGNRLDILEGLSTAEILFRVSDDLELFSLFGFLSIFLARRGVDQALEAAWLYVNELYARVPVLAHVLSEYLSDGALPEVPTSRSERLRKLETEFNLVLDTVEKSLSRRRQYRRLASNIWQQNIQEIFSPMLNEIRKGSGLDSVIGRIETIDPESLVTKSYLLDQTPHELATKVIRKLTNDGQEVLDHLNSAARLRLQLDRARQAADDGEYQEFVDFQFLAKEIGPAGCWAFKTLLPDCFQRLEKGASVISTDREMLRNAVR